MMFYGRRFYGAAAWPEPRLTARCAYCGRTQDRRPDGGCVSCGAPLPHLDRAPRSVVAPEDTMGVLELPANDVYIEVTSHSDPHRKFVRGH